MSSLSMNKVRGRAINANTQNTNNYSMWMEPLSHGDYPVTYVANPTQNAVVSSNGVKNVVVAQPGLLYNQARLDVSGSVNPTRWTTGQTINTVFLESTQMAQRSDAVANGTYFIRYATARDSIRYATARDSISFHSIPFHFIPFHFIPFHSISFHSINNTTNRWYYFRSRFRYRFLVLF